MTSCPCAVRSGSRSLLGVLSLVLLGTVAVGCGGGSGAGTTSQPRTGDPSSPTAAPGTARPTTPQGTAAAIADLCGLVGATAVSAALGEQVTAGTTQTAMGSTSCTFTASSGTTVVLAITPGFASLSGWKSQMQALGMTEANSVPGIGEAAYAKSGLPFGEKGASFAAYEDHTGIDARITSSADPAALLAAATTIGTLLFRALP